MQERQQNKTIVDHIIEMILDEAEAEQLAQAQ